MRSVIFAIALACAPLSGCATPGGAVTSSTQDERALLAAEGAMYAANTAASTAVDMGLLTPGSAKSVQIADSLNAAKAALNLARAAHVVGNSTEYFTQMSAVNAALSKAVALIPETTK